MKRKGQVSCGLYYKHMMIVIDHSSAVNKLGASLTDNARVIFYDYHMFIVQATGVFVSCWLLAYDPALEVSNY
jgi:hypothetical protein